MMSVPEFLDVCKQLTRTQSDSNLARKVEITRAAISAYRKGISFPTDENMIRLAKRAGLEMGESLLLLNIWRAEGEAGQCYVRLMESLYPGSEFM